MAQLDLEWFANAGQTLLELVTLARLEQRVIEWQVQQLIAATVEQHERAGCLVAVYLQVYVAYGVVFVLRGRRKYVNGPVGRK